MKEIPHWPRIDISVLANGYLIVRSFNLSNDKSSAIDEMYCFNNFKDCSDFIKTVTTPMAERE